MFHGLLHEVSYVIFPEIPEIQNFFQTFLCSFFKVFSRNTSKTTWTASFNYTPTIHLSNFQGLLQTLFKWFLQKFYKKVVQKFSKEFSHCSNDFSNDFIRKSYRDSSEIPPEILYVNLSKIQKFVRKFL